MRLVDINKLPPRAKGPWFLTAQLCCALFFLLLMGGEALAAYRADLMLRVATEADSSYLGAGVYEAAAVTQTRSQAAYTGIPAQFKVLLRNAGDENDSFVLTAPASGSAFTVSYLDQGGVDRAAALSGSGYRTPILAPGEALTLLVQVLPVQFTLGASYRVAVTAVSVGDPFAVDQVKTETVACGLTAAVTVSAPPDGSGAPGSVVNYPYTVTNVGNAVNSFTLSLPGGGWRGELYADDGAGGGTAGDGVRQPGETRSCTSTGPLAPGNSYRFFLAVTVPETGTDGARAEALLAVAGDGANGTDRVTTNAIAAVLAVTEGVRNLTQGGIFSADANALPGDLLQYRMGITNSGSAPATAVGIESPLPSGLTLQPDSLRISLAADGEGASCAALQCGSARLAEGSIVARLGEGATETAGGTLLPGRTLYLFFKAQVQ